MKDSIILIDFDNKYILLKKIYSITIMN